MMSTTQQHRRLGSIRRLGLFLAILMLFLVPQAAVMAPSSHTPAACAFAPLAASEAELSHSAKHAAFAAVLGPDGRYGDDTFPLASTFAPSENLIPPILLKSIAGIESDWTQYSGTQTLVNWGSCDYGMLLINAVHAAVFASTPSLLSTTRGNIAAGAMVFSQLWDAGSVGTLPIVTTLTHSGCSTGTIPAPATTVVRRPTAPG